MNFEKELSKYLSVSWRIFKKAKIMSKKKKKKKGYITKGST